MYDRPTAAELIQAAREHLEKQVLAVTKATNPRLYFQTLVAVSVLGIVERELALGDAHLLAEWARLDDLLGEQPRPDDRPALVAGLTERNADLCQRIRAGEFDQSSDLVAHLTATTIAQLEVANPRYLATLAAEAGGAA